MADKREKVWIVDDDRSIRWVLERALLQADFDATCFENAEQALQRLGDERPDAVVSDIRMPGADGLSLLQQIHDRFPSLPVIIMTAYADLDRAVAAFQGGAFEYLPKPFDIDDAVNIVRRAVRKIGTGAKVVQAPKAEVTEIVGVAPAMQELFRAIGRLSRSNMTVLITGESGTGKELVARALHRHSPRANRAFIALNTAAIPRELLESELFGHERGAFTGATAQRVGRFEQADRGTLFLDEIGDMPAELQTRLLRVLAAGEYYRVGGMEPVKVDVRVIAATHQDLEARVKAGAFREDLFHRLNVIRLHIPALRERKEDLGVLARHFLTSAANELGVEVKTLLPETEAWLAGYEWPGNVRQLENVCRYLTVMAPTREVHVDDLPGELRAPGQAAVEPGGDWEAGLATWLERKLRGGAEGVLNEATPAFERIVIETALRITGGRRQDAARLLGWGRNTLTRKIAELNLDV
ncbi:MAG: nitrogen regulation protein NR(I) [Gammaproteobacteria bacterium]